MNQHAIQRIAYAYPARFGIVDNSGTFPHIPIHVKISMANSGSGLYDRNTGILTHILNQSTTATRNQQIHITACLQQSRRGLTFGRQ